MKWCANNPKATLETTWLKLSMPRAVAGILTFILFYILHIIEAKNQSVSVRGRVTLTCTATWPIASGR